VTVSSIEAVAEEARVLALDFHRLASKLPDDLVNIVV
jgi:hypothetical protein